MRPASLSSASAAPSGAASAGAAPTASRSDAATLRKLLPYLWNYRWRVMLALSFMVGAKLANVGVPLLLKTLVDDLTLKPGDPRAMLVVPLGLLLAYGLLRLSTSLFTELRELIFAKATEGAARSISLQVFRHLHSLSLRFHLERQTGGMTRDIERGTRGVHSLISYSLYSIFPTLIEVTLVLSLLAVKFDAWFAWITVVALVVYIIFTISVTNWRTQFRKHMNELDSTAHTKAIDSLLNYETVKYFNNESYEARRYDESLERLRRAALKSQTTLSILNTGQQLIIATGLIVMLWRATSGVVDGRMTLGDLVMVNAFMIQLYIPLNFLGVIYREIKQSLTDLDKMFTLMEREREIDDALDAKPLQVSHGRVSFEHVSFAYEPARPILHDLSFEIPPGKTIAVVGPSGAGKSTLARLLYRFYDVNSGAIRIDGQDVRHVTQASLRQSIGIVPQDTVLFNEHRLRPHRREPGRGRSGGKGGADPRLHRVDTEGLRDDGRRARAEALGRREAAGGDRAHAAEEPANHDLRRSDVGARLGQRARDPGRVARRRAQPHRTRDRASAVDGRRRASDSGDGARAHRRARHARGAAGDELQICRDVEAAAIARGR